MSVVTSWLHHGYIMVTSWLHHGTSLLHPGYIMVISWVHHRHIMVSSWLHCGYITVASQLHRGYIMVTCPSLCSVCFSWYTPSCVRANKIQMLWATMLQTNWPICDNCIYQESIKPVKSAQYPPDIICMATEAFHE